jgi:predicted ferric reductase
LIVIYLALVLTPLGLAWAQGLPVRTAWDELASGLGLVALAMILVEFAQIGRFRAVTARVGSDVVMRSHQLAARVALVFAVLHPFFYVSAMGDPPAWDTTRQTAISQSWRALWPGILAWLGLGMVVTMALARDVAGYRYEIWRGLHGLGAVLVAGGGVLHALRAGRYSGDDLLGLVWIGGLGLALAALATVYVLAPALRAQRPWRVRSVSRAARRTWRLRLAPEGAHRLRYRAGQFAWLTIGRGPFSLSDNPFSIASAPSQGRELEFVIKELGDMTDRIGELAPGTRVYVDGAHGHLTLTGQEDAPGVALIAGGVGIAPLLGILREMAAGGDPRPSLLIYANRIPEQIVCDDELQALARDHGTQLVHVLSEPPEGWTGETGFVDARMLRRHVAEAGLQDWLFVVCGPPPMLHTVEAALLEMGVPARRILSEQFIYD